jgi:anhydro-N-acetylmuramic acid kinase
MREVWAIGLMTGTALDGFVDAALIKTDGKVITQLGEFILSPYDEGQRKILAEAVKTALEWNFNGPKPAIFEQATQIVTEIYAKAVSELLQKANMKPQDIAFIGGHGLTLVHRPPLNGKLGQTLQILDGQKLADLTQIATIYDFRTHDMECGGQGAPLAPIYHAALLQFANLVAPCAILNLGGVANITYWNGEENLAAFDCGPANGPINEWIEINGKGKYDKDGIIASQGKVDENLINQITSAPWFNEKFPKSLDRYDYSAKLVDNLTLFDGAATLCALVGASVEKAFKLLPKMPKSIVLAGGGRKNPRIINEIESRAQVVCIDADEIGLRGDAIEAECFGFLAVRSANKMPLSYPNTTGVAAATIGGKLAIPSN